MKLRGFLGNYIGDRAFYRKLWMIVVPIVVQNGITNLVSLIDNIMVGRVGTEQMSGVAISNQLLFVFNICIFGALSGAGIFGAQFFGHGDSEGARYTMRYKLIIGAIIAAGGLMLFSFFMEPLITLYLHDSENGGDVALTLSFGMSYMRIMLIGLIPFTVAQVYSSTLRECGETVWPMRAGVCAVLVNMVLNYVLIFGKLGVPALGVRGAAIATVVSRFAEMGIIVTRTHRHTSEYSFAKRLYRSIKLPMPLARRITVRGLPLLANEALWALGQAAIAQCYSTRGLDVVGAVNISSTISNLFATVYFAMGSAISIIVGQQLGAGDMEGARDTDRKLITTGVLGAAAIGVVMAAIARVFPLIYNTTDAVRSLASSFIIVASVMLPINSFIHNCYFTLRSGGKTVVTFLFDSTFVWCISIPVAFALSYYTAIPILPLYIGVQSLELIKCVIGFVLVRRGVWLNNIVANAE